MVEQSALSSQSICNGSHHSNKTGASPSAPPMMHPSINKAENDLSPASGKEELSPPDKLIEKTSCYVEIMRPTTTLGTNLHEASCDWMLPS